MHPLLSAVRSLVDAPGTACVDRGGILWIDSDRPNGAICDTRVHLAPARATVGALRDAAAVRGEVHGIAIVRVYRNPFAVSARRANVGHCFRCRICHTHDS